jgi:putative transposase
MRPITIRQDLTPSELRKAAKKEKNAGVCRRLLAMIHLIEGGTREEAQSIACLTHNTFRTWLKRFNEEGASGLKHKAHTGRPVKLSPEVRADLKRKALEGPSQDEGLVRYRIEDFQKYIQDQHNISISSSCLWYNLQDLNISWKTGRQRHPRSDVLVQEAFKKTSKTC